MSKIKELPVFLLWCDSCKKKHYMQNQPCSSCQGRGGNVIIPVSETVCGAWWRWYKCDGCEAYEDRYK